MGQNIFSGAVTLSFFYISSPLLFPIAMGAILAVLFFPWLEQMKKRKIPAALGSAILTLGITVVLLLPSSFLIFFVAKAGFQQLQTWKATVGSSNGFIDSLMNMPLVHRFMVWLAVHFPVSMPELGDSFQELAASIGAKLTEFLGGIFTHLPGMVTGLLVIVVSVYFFLVDGPRLLQFIRRNSIFNPHQTEELTSSLYEMCRSVILASVVSGAAQAVLEVLACFFTGTPNVPLIGGLVFAGSFIPVVGSFPITLGVALHQFVEGNEAVGVTLGVMSLIIVGVDNTVRPMFLRGSANLHPLLAFVAAFGGLQTLGFFGVFLGPVIASLFVVTVRILTEKS